MNKYFAIAALFSVASGSTEPEPSALSAAFADPDFLATNAEKLDPGDHYHGPRYGVPNTDYCPTCEIVPSIKSLSHHDQRQMNVIKVFWNSRAPRHNDFSCNRDAPDQTECTCLCGQGGGGKTVGGLALEHPADCHMGEQPDSTGHACEPCSEGFWHGTHVGTCQECPPGHVCSGGAADPVLDVCPEGDGYEETRVGGSATKPCPPLFSGEYTKVCQPGGQWAEPTDTCTRIQCLGNDEYGTTDSDIYATRPCPNHYSGEYRKLCLASGQWANSESNSCVRINCPSGQRLSNGMCINCLPGSHRHHNDATGSCSQCQAGKYQNAHSATSCINCQAGTYRSTGGATNCAACQSGKYQSAAASTSCISCLAGKYRTNTGATALAHCVSCQAGRYQNNAGSSSCINCAVGTYRTTAGASSSSDCQACPTDTTTPSTDHRNHRDALADCNVDTACPNGRYLPTGHSNCLDCDNGKYRHNTHSLTYCTQCPGGMYQNVPSNGCKVCPRGTYFTGRGAGSADDCDACPSGRTTAEIGDAQQRNELNDCSLFTSCPGGQRLANDQCYNCAAGQYRHPNHPQSTCRQCQIGMYQNTEGTTGCINCQQGKYRTTLGASSSGDCLNCPTDTTTPSTNHRNHRDGLGDCNVKTNCPGGQRLENNACYNCGPGTRRHSTQSASSCHQCQIGMYQDGHGATHCIICAVGKYRTTLGASSSGHCLNCPTDTTTPSTNDRNHRDGLGDCNVILNCPGGQFLNSAGGCQNCGVGTYRHSSHAVGTCSQCRVGEYQNTNGASSCIMCQQGKYRTTVGASSSGHCLACPTDTTTPSQNLRSNRDQSSDCNVKTGCPAGQMLSSGNCYNCLAGTYRHSNDPVGGCLQCRVGKYQDANAASSCKMCQQGKYRTAVGASKPEHCEDCPTDTTTPSPNLRSNRDEESDCNVATNCPGGQFVNAGACQNCPANQYRGNRDFDPSMCNDHRTCNAGYYFDGGTALVNGQCKFCQNGRYQNDNGHRNACKYCDAGKYTDGAGHGSCKVCPRGKWQQHHGQTQCTQCPASKSTPGGGTTSNVCNIANCDWHWGGYNHPNPYVNSGLGCINGALGGRDKYFDVCNSVGSDCTGFWLYRQDWTGWGTAYRGRACYKKSWGTAAASAGSSSQVDGWYYRHCHHAAGN